MIDMVLENISGISYPQDLQVFFIIYGVLGYHNDVSTSVWERLMLPMMSSISMRRLKWM